MESEHYVGKVTQKVVIEHAGNILLCQGVGDKRWDLPGGRLHKDCHPKENLLREVEEELGLQLESAHPFHVCRSFHYQTETYRVYIAYKGKVSSSDFSIDQEELDLAEWFPIEKAMCLHLFEDAREVLEVYTQNFCVLDTSINRTL